MNNSTSRLLIILLITLGLYYVNALHPPPAHLVTPAVVLKNLGAVGVDGSLRVGYTLGTIKELFITNELHLNVGSDIDGQPKSDWKITGLETILTRGQMGDVSWLDINGAHHSFRAGRDANTRYGRGGFRYTRTAPSELSATVRDATGSKWIYADGVLVAIDVVQGMRYEVQSDGRFLNSIKLRMRSGLEKEIMKATYGPGMELEQLVYNGNEAYRFEYRNDRMVMFVDKAGHKTMFAYKDNLLSSIDRNGREIGSWIWKTTGSKNGPDKQIRAFAVVVDDKISQYDYKETDYGLIIGRHSRDGGNFVTLFNPALRRVWVTGPGIRGIGFLQIE